MEQNTSEKLFRKLFQKDKYGIIIKWRQNFRCSFETNKKNRKRGKR